MNANTICSLDILLIDLPQIKTNIKILTFGKNEHKKDHDI